MWMAACLLIQTTFVEPGAAEPNKMILSGFATDRMRRTISRNRVSSTLIFPLSYREGAGAEPGWLCVSGGMLSEC